LAPVAAEFGPESTPFFPVAALGETAGGESTSKRDADRLIFFASGLTISPSQLLHLVNVEWRGMRMNY
ncbi:MAG: hypothetical protein WBL40_04635, partial [Terrimicrobiaceae bacterium]